MKRFSVLLLMCSASGFIPLNPYMQTAVGIPVAPEEPQPEGPEKVVYHTHTHLHAVKRDDGAEDLIESEAEKMAARQHAERLRKADEETRRLRAQLIKQENTFADFRDDITKKLNIKIHEDHERMRRYEELMKGQDLIVVDGGKKDEVPKAHFDSWGEKPPGNSVVEEANGDIVEEREGPFGQQPLKRKGGEDDADAGDEPGDSTGLANDQYYDEEGDENADDVIGDQFGVSAESVDLYNGDDDDDDDDDNDNDDDDDDNDDKDDDDDDDEDDEEDDENNDSDKKVRKITKNQKKRTRVGEYHIIGNPDGPKSPISIHI